MSYKKDFDQWNKVLKNLEKKRKLPWFAEREIWMVAWGIGSGSELDGKGRCFGRPALVYKKETSRKFLAIPLTGSSKKMSGWIQYDFGSVVIAEARTLDANRLLRKKKKMSPKDFDKIQEAYAEYLGFQFK